MLSSQRLRKWLWVVGNGGSENHREIWWYVIWTLYVALISQIHGRALFQRATVTNCCFVPRKDGLRSQLGNAERVSMCVWPAVPSSPSTTCVAGIALMVGFSLQMVSPIVELPSRHIRTLYCLTYLLITSFESTANLSFFFPFPVYPHPFLRQD